jgi:hypothetical protein
MSAQRKGVLANALANDIQLADALGTALAGPRPLAAYSMPRLARASVACAKHCDLQRTVMLSRA